MRDRFVFRHQRLDVYQVAIEVVRFVEGLDGCWFRGNPDRRRQLCRAADSIALNVAEGSSRALDRAGRIHYRIAMGPAGECDGILHLLEVRRAPVARGRELLGRIGSMLCRMG